MVKSTKAFSLILAVVMMISLMAGCGTSSNPSDATTLSDTSKAGTSATTESSVPKDKVSLVCLQPGDISKRMEEFLAGEYKDRMLQDLNIELTVNYASWANYINKLELMLASGEPLDWYWDSQDYLSSRISKKQCVPLNELLDNYGQSVKSMIPSGNFNLTSVDGKIYAIPSMVTPVADVFMSVLARQDILDNVGITKLESMADVMDACDKIKAKFPDMTPLPGALTLPIQKEVWAEEPITAIGLQSLQCLFYVRESDDNKVYFGMEPKDKFLKRCSMAAEFVKKNYVSEQELTEPGNYMTRFESGNYALTLGAIARPMENTLNIQKNVPEAQLVEYRMSPDKDMYIRGGPGGNLEISPNCKNPERAMMFFNWIYQSEENYDFHVYGVKDMDYKITEDGRIQNLTSDSLWYEWEFRNIKFIKFPTYVGDKFINEYLNWDVKAKYSKMYGFSFDSKDVKAEEAKILSVVASRLSPLTSGYSDAEKDYDKVLEEFKAVGIDKYMVELQKQVDVFLASK